MATSQNLNYPRGIELVGGVIVENDKGEILLGKCPKWGNKWILPGGHIEPGETIVASQLREAEEETGLKLRPIAITSWGELINSRDFHRPAHFVYFDAYCKIAGGEFKLDNQELVAYQWLIPAEALKLDLAESYDKSIEEYIKYINSRNL
ncbi:MAG: NUDIX domain-containing protein [Candidatus Kerfeldbacteria bacterium]|nr:NUDIX domain-containing protein [Candidatus Kerfeldbacteria bacterium]